MLDRAKEHLVNGIFLFEDDILLSNVMADELRDLGYRVDVFCDVSGVDLIGMLRPALIILDLTLDHTDAVEVIQALSEAAYNGPIQLISGSRFEMLDRVKRIGERRGLTMLPVLQKPFAITDLDLAALDMVQAIPIPSRDRCTARMDGWDRRIDLGLALDRDWVEVWYQPKYDMETLSLVGAECLCRIRHPEHGVLGPIAFLPGAAIDDMRRLTEFIIKQSCEDWVAFSAAGRALRLAINIPCELLVTMPLARLLRQAKPQSPDWPGLILEVTEEQALRDIDAAHEIGTQLAIYGVDLSIDDFGTGYSSLSRLRDIPFKEVKLDRSLVDGCVRDVTRAALCRAIIDLSHALGAATVAEGIEHLEDLAFLRAAGCDKAQGYLLARPMTRDALVATIHGNVDHVDRLGLGRTMDLVA